MREVTYGDKELDAELGGEEEWGMGTRDEDEAWEDVADKKEVKMLDWEGGSGADEVVVEVVNEDAEEVEAATEVFETMILEIEVVVGVVGTEVADPFDADMVVRLIGKPPGLTLGTAVVVLAMKTN
jgi:hypothetical protein